MKLCAKIKNKQQNNYTIENWIIFSTDFFMLYIFFMFLHRMRVKLSFYSILWYCLCLPIDLNVFYFFFLLGNLCWPWYAVFNVELCRKDYVYSIKYFFFFFFVSLGKIYVLFIFFIFMFNASIEIHNTH